MEIGNSARVQDGIMSPDFDNLKIGGWEGRIVNFSKDILTIELDSLTLARLTEGYLIDCFADERDFAFIYLGMNEVELTVPRDTRRATAKKQQDINLKYSLKDADKRIAQILDAEDNSVHEENHQKYLNYLKTSIKKPCILTGIEDFDWEEPFLFGKGKKSEYEKMRATNPSYQDEFEYIEITDLLDEKKGVMANVNRVSDNQQFSLPLWDLKTTEFNYPNYLIVSDYSYWMTNYPRTVKVAEELGEE
ncbi:hypothetical protein [Williamwhitmania taraxaci]|uniref:Uncharacterized protein n=1 Tax=Williamwhitmania taraxaci TaxID=1640674 RepID=A0A1G6J9C6_9BACT|nr:hypothetical protein [Williamwhitmania taraxaci]SDC14955.1 hypothetical protein SAMN05216323_10197 [Williamwhitmania taraxaci]